MSIALSVSISSLDCGPLSAPDHGSVVLIGGTTVGALAVYDCEDGYVLKDGQDSRECQLTGTWNLQMPVCIPTSKYEYLPVLPNGNSHSISPEPLLQF